MTSSYQECCPDCENVVVPFFIRFEYEDHYSLNPERVSVVSMKCPVCGWRTDYYSSVKECKKAWKNTLSKGKENL